MAQAIKELIGNEAYQGARNEVIGTSAMSTGAFAATKPTQTKIWKPALYARLSRQNHESPNGAGRGL